MLLLMLKTVVMLNIVETVLKKLYFIYKKEVPSQPTRSHVTRNTVMRIPESSF